MTNLEQQLLRKVQQKIDAIYHNILSASGLTQNEAKIAVKAGLIDVDQMYWWLESWQKREREAAKDLSESEVSKEFSNIEELKKYLKS